MDASIINPFLNATINLFYEMFLIEPTYGKPFLANPAGNHRWEISGVIGVVGSHEGIVVLRVTQLMAEKLLSRSGLQITDPDEIPQLLNEMIGEFVNIISGNALGALKGRDVALTPPFTAQGTNHSISWPSKTPIIGVPFSTKYGPFEVQVSIIQSKENK